jgi:demethylmenaquinone methyltransferase / 2-methoxy-6-polyprenyl-1,4-benzoquinol methylase
MNKQKQVKRIFDSISGKYDLLNHLLSAGVDIYWRKKAIRLSGLNKDSILLDVACGTGDFAITARKSGVNNIFGADLSHNMLSLFSKKAEWIEGKSVQAVAENIPFKENSFTNITVAFGIRNFYSIPEGLASFHRVLKPGGKTTVLEFRLPSNKLVLSFYLFYFNKVLPFVGRLVSKDNEAYTYLPQSVGDFHEKIDLVSLMNDAGFKKVKKYSLTFGLTQVVIGEK